MMEQSTARERFWLALCTISFLVYLLVSEPLRAFAHEAARLAAKL